MTIAAAICLATAWAQDPARESLAPRVSVTEQANAWLVAGTKTTFTLRKADLALDVQAGPARWSMLPGAAGELVVKSGGQERALRLRDADEIAIVPYRTGFRTGLKLALSGWGPGTEGLKLWLTLGIEGQDEDLVLDLAAEEKTVGVRRLDWPQALDASEVEYTVLPAVRGTLLPRNWDKQWNPIRPPRPEGASPDTSEIQSNVIESWSMSWWGFKKGRSAMMLIVETPDGAAYQFRHPAGGPTVIGPRWRASLGRLAYRRTARMCFLADGDYVTMAKRYRRHAKESGLHVSLAEKIAREPKVRSLIGTPLTRLSILRNLKEESQRYDKNDPSKNYSLQTFDERARQMRELRAKGIQKFHVCLTGWPWLGYDRQHPDELPPAPKAGGVLGMKRFAETCRELGYLLTLSSLHI